MDNEEESGYEKLSEEELISLLEERNLDSSGTKEEMITKLHEDDEEEEEEEGYFSELTDKMENDEDLRKTIEEAVENQSQSRIEGIIQQILGNVSWEMIKKVAEKLFLMLW
ncbi:hypothetical protein OAJ13_00825 [Euryarchaeota archaeon]|nr:hypothetical protein [Euryarchaeota archaeon]